ncbi:hypothetical protein LEP3755_66840 (plasmid) [Leptolyngbya sp. NIES-3755]|nr:hypothetical protein LEP3755_66840 [Leptolyngbya sp. NIES-3755]
MITLALELNKTLFSGYPFEVQPAQGLVGQCDYLLSRSPRMTDSYPPISLIVEVKRDLDCCLPHCLVEMVAAEQFNRSDAPIYGALTTGLQWQFLKLEGNRVTIKRTVYQFEPFNPVVAMLAGMLTAGDPVVETGDADVEPTD